MNSKIHVEEYSGRYRQLVEQKDQSSEDQQMAKFVNIIGGGIFLSLIFYQLKYTHFRPPLCF
jgi:hypothetical protein